MSGRQLAMSRGWESVSQTTARPSPTRRTPRTSYSPSATSIAKMPSPRVLGVFIRAMPRCCRSDRIRHPSVRSPTFVGIVWRAAWASLSVLPSSSSPAGCCSARSSRSGAPGAKRRSCVSRPSRARRSAFRWLARWASISRGRGSARGSSAALTRAPTPRPGRPCRSRRPTPAPPCAGAGTAGSCEGTLTVPQPGDYVLGVSGLQPPDAPEYAVVFMRVFAGQMLRFILTCVLLGTLLVGSLVLAILSAAL